jgi:hypothetical protein
LQEHWTAWLVKLVIHKIPLQQRETWFSINDKTEKWK